MSVRRMVYQDERIHVRYVLTEPSTETLGGKNLLNLLKKLDLKNTSTSKITQRAFRIIREPPLEREIFTNRRFHVG